MSKRPSKDVQEFLDSISRFGPKQKVLTNLNENNTKRRKIDKGFENLRETIFQYALFEPIKKLHDLLSYNNSIVIITPVLEIMKIFDCEYTSFKKEDNFSDKITLLIRDKNMVYKNDTDSSRSPYQDGEIFDSRSFLEYYQDLSNLLKNIYDEKYFKKSLNLKIIFFEIFYEEVFYNRAKYEFITLFHEIDSVKITGTEGLEMGEHKQNPFLDEIFLWGLRYNKYWVLEDINFTETIFKNGDNLKDLLKFDEGKPFLKKFVETKKIKYCDIYSFFKRYARDFNRPYYDNDILCEVNKYIKKEDLEYLILKFYKNKYEGAFSAVVQFADDACKKTYLESVAQMPYKDFTYAIPCLMDNKNRSFNFKILIDTLRHGCSSKTFKIIECDKTLCNFDRPKLITSIFRFGNKSIANSMIYKEMIFLQEILPSHLTWLSVRNSPKLFEQFVEHVDLAEDDHSELVKIFAFGNLAIVKIIIDKYRIGDYHIFKEIFLKIIYCIGSNHFKILKHILDSKTFVEENFKNEMCIYSLDRILDSTLKKRVKMFRTFLKTKRT